MSVGTQRLRDDADRLRAGAIAKREDPKVVDAALEADAARRALSQRVDTLRTERKRLSAEVGALLGGKPVVPATDPKVLALKAESQKVATEMEGLEKELAADVREKYERVVKHKGADGMAPVEGQSCGGCFQQITGNMLSDLMLGRVVMCRSCGRLLYVPESSASA